MAQNNSTPFLSFALKIVFCSEGFAEHKAIVAVSQVDIDEKEGDWCTVRLDNAPLFKVEMTPTLDDTISIQYRLL